MRVGHTLWMDDMGDNVQECGLGTSGEFARPLPCVSLERRGTTISQIGDLCSGNEGTTPLTEGVLVLEFGAHYDLSGG
jgi:hypothetical protein